MTAARRPRVRVLIGVALVALLMGAAVQLGNRGDVSEPTPPDAAPVSVRAGASPGGVSLLQAPFRPGAPSAPGPAFTRVDGASLGFERLPLPRPYQVMEPGVMHMGGLAAGDVDADGWPDVAVGTHVGVYLYRNLGGRFALQEIDFPAMREWIVGDVALVDLDGDGALDLFFTTWMHGSHVLLNRSGAFSLAHHVQLPRGEETAVHSAAFADVDRDGDVDVVTGATTHVPRFFYPEHAVDRLWRNDGDARFTPEPLEGPAGEALTLLFHDFDGDLWPDLFVGNDYDEPDRFFRNVEGRLVPLDRTSAPMPVTPYDTMSADTGDIDNDGREEVFLGGIAPPVEGGPLRRVSNGAGACRAFADPADRAQCEALARFQSVDDRAYTGEGVAVCAELQDLTERRDCVVSAHHWNRVLVRLPAGGADKESILDECAAVPADFTTMKDICRAIETSPLDGEGSAEAFPDEVVQEKQTNFVYAPTSAGYEDVTAQWGVGVAGWTWNAKFADVDNDGWQDLYVAGGTRLREKNLSASLFLNRSGRVFEDVAPGAGLEDFTPTGSSLFLDYDVDGDLDLLTHPFQLTPALFRNDAPASAGLEIRLDDRSSRNRFGMGASVEIVSADGRRQVRTVKGSGGYQSHDVLAARFGLGDWTSVAQVLVRWPDGTTTDLAGLTLGPGRHTLIRQ